jgi:histidine triad (HIT) family protein
MSDTIFGKIIRREIAADIVYEDDKVLAFKDIFPKAPVHYLVVPKQPIATLNDATVSDQDLLGHMLLTTAELARQAGIAESGYQVKVNCNADGGQEVYHIHLHLLGGCRL